MSYQNNFESIKKKSIMNRNGHSECPRPEIYNEMWSTIEMACGGALSINIYRRFGFVSQYLTIFSKRKEKSFNVYP